MLQRSIPRAACAALPRVRLCGPARLLAAIVVSSAAFAGTAAADTYSCTGADQTTTAPPGAQSAQVDLIGAAGGNSSTAPGGDGAEVQATIPVSPGEQLTLVVGCQGTLTAGGYGGGGPNGESHTGSTADNGAGGGGATAVLPGGDDNFADAFAIAAGGGGGAAVGQAGGGRGGDADANGGGGGADFTFSGGFFPGGAGGASGDNGGGGGSVAGPPQGTYIDYTGGNLGGPGSDGGDGSAGQGGAGGESYQGASSDDAGGGGGGGLIGGGGGGSGIESTNGGAAIPSSGGGGGGGGSSATQHGAVQVGSTAISGSGDGSATITYVIQRATSTSIGCSGAIQLGQATTCTATVTDTEAGAASTPTGSVSFTSESGGSFSGGGSCTLSPSGTSGVSSCQVTYTPPAATGSETLTASYSGDVTHAPSGGQTTLMIGRRDTSAAAACPGSQTVDQPSTCTVTVADASGGTASAPSGNVSFTSSAGGSFSGGGSCALAASGTSGVSSCQVTYTPTTIGSGTHTITAAYAGDTTHSSSQGTTSISVVAGTLGIDTAAPSSRSGTAVDPGVTLSCPPGGPSCTVTEQASTILGAIDTPIGPPRGPHGPVSVGSAQFSIPAGGSVQAVFGLNALGQTLVGDHPQLPVQVTLSGQVGSGPPTSATKQVVLAGSPAHDRVSSVYLNHGGTLSLRVKVTSPGQVEVLLTAWRDNLATAARALDPAPRRLVYGRATMTARRAGTFTIRVVPNRTGRRLLAHPSYRVTLRLWASYIPLYAFQTDAGYYGLHLGAGCASCQRRIWP